MCGVAGFVMPSMNIEPRSVLRAMATTIAHRGPDDEGFFETRTKDERYQVGLAHRRLSIIDLSTGHQPMGNEDGSVQIVFNGEIYNFQSLRTRLIAAGHRFTTTSDTETIVHAYEEWGEQCVNYFRGMFAFAIWDARKDKLLLVRDRFGKKPLFFCEFAGGVVFGSEIKSVLAFPGVNAEVDMESTWNYFAYRYVPTPGTLFKNIRKLPPGSYAVWSKGQFTQNCYYYPPDRIARGETALPSDPVRAFLDKLDESVRIRMISDVPFGAFLSGGMDSSAIVALMSRHSTLPVKTFSVGFKEAAFNELEYARLIASEFRSDHHELIVSVDQLMSLLPRLVRLRDAPVAEPSDIPIYLLSVEARKTVKMVLTGEGADEFLGGYPKHVYEHYVGRYQNIPRMVRHGLLEPLVRSLPYSFHRAKTAIVNLGLESYSERMPRWFGAMTASERKELVAFDAPMRQNRAPLGTEAGNSPLRQILYFDQTSWLPDNLLERGDSMTMGASLEGRMPFMDHELNEFVSTLPDHYRVRGQTRKWILREAMKPILPATILGRQKVGFKVPVNEWFRGPMRDYLLDHLSGPGSLTMHYYHKPALNQILEQHIKGRQNHEKLLWSLLNLEIWHRQYLT